jgi:hypothetical protein
LVCAWIFGYMVFGWGMLIATAIVVMLLNPA